MEPICCFNATLWRAAGGTGGAQGLPNAPRLAEWRQPRLNSSGVACAPGDVPDGALASSSKISARVRPAAPRTGRLAAIGRTGAEAAGLAMGVLGAGGGLGIGGTTTCVGSRPAPAEGTAAVSDGGALGGAQAAERGAALAGGAHSASGRGGAAGTVDGGGPCVTTATGVGGAEAASGSCRPDGGSAFTKGGGVTTVEGRPADWPKLR